MDKNTPTSGKSNFWTTLPGMITAIAALITAVVGALAVIRTIPSRPPEPTPTPTSTASAPATTPSPATEILSASATADGSTYTVESGHLAAYSANESLLTLKVKVRGGDHGMGFTPEMFRLEVDDLKLSPESTLSGKWVDSDVVWKEDVKFIIPNTANTLALIVGYAGSPRTARIPLSKDTFSRNPS